MLLLHHLDNFAPLVFPAVRAHAVRQLGLMTVRALRQAGLLQRVMRASRRGALFGMSSFRIRHKISLVPQPTGSFFSVQMFKRRPAIVGQSPEASALLLIPVLSTLRTDPLAIFTAYPLHRQRQ